MSEFQPNHQYRNEKKLANYISISSAVAILHGYVTLSADSQNLLAQLEFTGGIVAGLASRLYSASPELYERQAVYDKLEQAENNLALEPKTHSQKIIFVSKYLTNNEILNQDE